LKKGKREGRIPRTLDANPKEGKRGRRKKKGQTLTLIPFFHSNERKGKRIGKNKTLNLTLVFPIRIKSKRTNSKKREKGGKIRVRVRRG